MACLRQQGSRYTPYQTGRIGRIALPTGNDGFGLNLCPNTISANLVSVILCSVLIRLTERTKHGIYPPSECTSHLIIEDRSVATDCTRLLGIVERSWFLRPYCRTVSRYQGLLAVGQGRSSVCGLLRGSLKAHLPRTLWSSTTGSHISCENRIWGNLLVGSLLFPLLSICGRGQRRKDRRVSPEARRPPLLLILLQVGDGEAFYFSGVSSISSHRLFTDVSSSSSAAFLSLQNGQRLSILKDFIEQLLTSPALVVWGAHRDAHSHCRITRIIKGLISLPQLAVWVSSHSTA